jgi:Dihydrodipicolinate synthase/N-acetylneuraminate lyase
VPVIAGTGSNSTAEAIHLTRHAKEAGATAAWWSCPITTSRRPEGQYRHFKAIHDAVDLPIIIYNIPGRSVVDMSVETMARLAKLPNIVGVKDATNDLARPVRTKLAIQKEFCMLSGEDATVMAFLAQSGDGCISVSANVAPRMLSEMHGAWRKGDVKAAMAINERLTPLHEAMFCESSPGPVKYAASCSAIARRICACRSARSPMRASRRCSARWPPPGSRTEPGLGERPPWPRNPRTSPRTARRGSTTSSRRRWRPG